VNVIREIAIAKENQQHIVVLELAGDGETEQKIKEVLDNYDKKHYIIKHNNSGCGNLMNYLDGKNLDFNNFKICGVNSCSCVAATAQGLVDKHDKNIIMIDDACNCRLEDDEHEHTGLRKTSIEDNYAIIFNHHNVMVA